MCVAVPVEVIEIIENEGIVSCGGIRKKINLELIEDIKLGDYVLIHAGCAMEKIDKEEAQKTLELFKQLGND